MKTYPILFLLLFSSCAFGQSAKKLNKQLRVKVAMEQRKQDSAFVEFTMAKQEFDSVKGVMSKRINLLSNEERLAKRTLEKVNELSRQLKELGVDPNSLVVPLDSKTGNLPDSKEFTRVIKESSKKSVKFGKVSNELNLEGLKRKEQNTLLAAKIKEYQDNSKFNSLRLEDLESGRTELIGFFPKLDSLSQVYQLLIRQAGTNKVKLENKLNELRTNYIQKGPQGFPEAYKKVFYDAFPPPQEEEIGEVMKTLEWADGPYDIPEAEVLHTKPKDHEIYSYVDEEASFPGGREALKTFISKNLRFPEKMKEAGIQGKVYLKFIVSETGELSEITVLRGVSDCKECDEEAVRVVKMMPKWKPAKLKGRAVKSQYNLPINIHLN